MSTRFAGGYLSLKKKLAKLEGKKSTEGIGEALRELALYGTKPPAHLRPMVEKIRATAKAMVESVPKPPQGG